MEQRIRESFHLIWLAAIAVCCAAAVFALIFASCSKGGSDTASAVRGDSAAPGIVETDDDEVVISPASSEMPVENATPAAAVPSPAAETNDTEIIFDAEEVILPLPDETIQPEPENTILPEPEG